MRVEGGGLKVEGEVKINHYDTYTDEVLFRHPRNSTSFFMFSCSMKDFLTKKVLRKP